jgi:hypothetical protein
MTSNINPLNPELNPICHLLTLLGAHHILHVSRMRVNVRNLWKEWMFELFRDYQVRTEENPGWKVRGSNPCGARFSAVQTGSEAQPASCTMGTVHFPGVKCGWGVLLTTHPF